MSHYEKVEGSHHRLERREYVSVQIERIGEIPKQEEWSGLKSLMMVKSYRKLWNKETEETRFYISSLDTELIFVEGHSGDQTWESIQEIRRKTPQSDRFQILALQQKGVGKGDAGRLGFQEASGDVLMILDADMTVQPEDLSHFWEVIVSGRGEVVNGSRLVYPHSNVAMPFINRLANKFFAFLFSYLLSRPIKDTLCGTKVLWRRDYQRIAAERSYFGEFDPFGDFDLLFGAAHLGLQCVDVPVRYQPRSYGRSNIAHVKEGLVLLKMCWLAAQKLKFY